MQSRTAEGVLFIQLCRAICFSQITSFGAAAFAALAEPKPQK
jgi:hypothetical protein